LQNSTIPQDSGPFSCKKITLLYSIIPAAFSRYNRSKTIVKFIAKHVTTNKTVTLLPLLYYDKTEIVKENFANGKSYH
jgi:hypothetical protein